MCPHQGTGCHLRDPKSARSGGSRSNTSPVGDPCPSGSRGRAGHPDTSQTPRDAFVWAAASCPGSAPLVMKAQAAETSIVMVSDSELNPTAEPYQHAHTPLPSENTVPKSADSRPFPSHSGVPAPPAAAEAGVLEEVSARSWSPQPQITRERNGRAEPG